jgi:hypothetical protein
MAISAGRQAGPQAQVLALEIGANFAINPSETVFAYFRMLSLRNFYVAPGS